MSRALVLSVGDNEGDKPDGRDVIRCESVDWFHSAACSNPNDTNGFPVVGETSLEMAIKSSICYVDLLAAFLAHVKVNSSPY